MALMLHSLIPDYALGIDAGVYDLRLYDYTYAAESDYRFVVQNGMGDMGTKPYVLSAYEMKRLHTCIISSCMIWIQQLPLTGTVSSEWLFYPQQIYHP